MLLAVDFYNIVVRIGPAVPVCLLTGLILAARRCDSGLFVAQA
jgi:hypothetical protein